MQTLTLSPGYHLPLICQMNELEILQEDWIDSILLII